VVYIEPYPKSRALDLHEDSMKLGRSMGSSRDEASPKKVSCEPFVGIAPRRYLELFTSSKADRTQEDGSPTKWETLREGAFPKFTGLHPEFHSYYIPRETAELTEFKSKLTELKLIRQPKRKIRVNRV
jgi:hypothetical protein